MNTWTPHHNLMTPAWCSFRTAGFREELAGHRSHHQHLKRPLGASRGKRPWVHRDLGAGCWRRAGRGENSSINGTNRFFFLSPFVRKLWLCIFLLSASLHITNEVNEDLWPISNQVVTACLWLLNIQSDQMFFGVKIENSRGPKHLPCGTTFLPTNQPYCFLRLCEQFFSSGLSGSRS